MGPDRWSGSHARTWSLRDPVDVDSRRRTSRFVMQSHAVSAPIANPGSLLLAAVIGVVLVLIGRRVSH